MFGRGARRVHHHTEDQRHPTGLQRVEDAMQAERTRRDDEFAHAIKAWRERTEAGATGSAVDR